MWNTGLWYYSPLTFPLFHLCVSRVVCVYSILLLMIKMVMEYCQCADNLPMLVTEVMSKLIETLKVCQMHFYSLRIIPYCQLRNETTMYWYGNETCMYWYGNETTMYWYGNETCMYWYGNETTMYLYGNETCMYWYGNKTSMCPYGE